MKPRHSAQSAKSKGPARKSMAPVRAPSNPFTAGSAYAICYDLLAAHPQGITRPNLVKSLSELTGKETMKSFFDTSVVTSAGKDGHSHHTVKQFVGIYYVERLEDGRLKLVVRNGKTGIVEEDKRRQRPVKMRKGVETVKNASTNTQKRSARPPTLQK